ncbi:MAG: type III pantothenate kinase [Cyanobacteria bacterium SIG30]|nr:type III pantothenate kinase [Cyanobacteria bacterium SIG30]
MLLTVDIGNTNAGFRVFDGDDIILSFSLATDTNKLADEYGITILNLLKNANLADKINFAVISNVVTQLDNVFKEAIEKYLKIEARFVTHKLKMPFEIQIDEPKTLGADRIANAAAIPDDIKKPVIVIDFGTATTFDILDENKKFVGGLIAPGLLIQAKSLASFTSKLPKIKIEAPKNAIATNTIDAMMTGIVRGHAKMIEGMIEECEKELGQRAVIIATGGLSSVLIDCMERKFDILDKDLTFKGIKKLYELNFK